MVNYIFTTFFVKLFHVEYNLDQKKMWNIMKWKYNIFWTKHIN